MSRPPATDTFDMPSSPDRSPTSRTAGTPTDIDLMVRHRAFLAAATSDNTRRTYRSAIRHFYAWGGNLPCDEAAVVRYLLAYADTLNPRTLALRLTALSQWHLHQGFTDPASTPTVRKTLAGIARIHGKPKRKARPLPVEDVERIVTHLAGIDTLHARRDSALLQIGFFGGFRRSELASLEVPHIAWERDGIVITLQRSKTDQEGAGIVKAIPYGDETLCPVRALRAWLDAAGIQSGALFRPINRWGVVGAGALNPASVNTLLKACAKAAGMHDVPELSGHSLRRGMATSAYRAGANLRNIKRQGGWRHDGTVQGYIEEAAQFEDNAALCLLRRTKAPV